MENNKRSTSRILTFGLLMVALLSLGSMTVSCSRDENENPSPQGISITNAVWQRHINAWNDKDLDAITRDYDENAVLVLNNQVYVGRDQIRKVFTRLFEIFDPGVNTIDEAIIKERLVYITWHYKPQSDQDKVFFGTDTFVIERNAITYQTIASPLYDEYPVASP